MLIHLLLGFVPWESVPAWLEAASPAAATAEAAGIAALEAVTAMPALLLGAGVLGWTIGSYLKKTFAPEDPDPFPGIGGVLGGGQAGHRYQVTFAYETISGGPASQTANLEGPIIGMFEGDEIQGTAQRSHYWWLTYGPTHENFGPGLADDDIIIFPHITGFVPITEPDEDVKPLPATYPPAQPVPEKLSPTIPFPFLPGSPSLPSEIVPFKRPARTPGEEPLEPGEPEKPGVIVLIPGLGTGVEFTPDGIDVKNYNPQTAPLPDTQKDPRKVPPPSLPAICDCPCDLSDVIRRLKDLQNCDRCAAEYDYFTETHSGNSFAVTIASDRELVGMSLFVSEYPSNVKNQWGGDVAPDVLYLGWYSWTRESSPGERIPLNYAIAASPAPDGANGITCTLYTGCSGTLTVDSRKKRPYPPVD